MQFRLLKQRPKELDLKTICPSLHNDPAFSADPHSNPYSVTSHDSWLSPPPLGHPVLKNNKNRSNIVLTPHDTPGSGSESESDFHLIQPPNSPVIPSPISSPQLTKPLSVSSSSQALTYSVMSQGDRPSSLLPPPKKGNNRMIFRRQSAQLQPTKSFFSSIGNIKNRRSELPAFSDHATLPPRSVQHTSPSVAPKFLEQRSRLQDLDQVDELDETNPWGIPIHHGGPYEAVDVQVKQRVDNRIPLGLANNNGLYNMHTLQANGQTYIPPQAPTGVSLNLSPGQILPRQFLAPIIQPASVFRTLQPPDLYTPHIPAGPLLTPPYESQYKATIPDVDSGSKVHDLPPIKETMQHSDDVSFNIGMAMLELEDNAPVPSPHVFLSQAELPDEQGFDSCGPINPESEYRRVPSPLASAQPEPSGSQQFQNASSMGTLSSSNLDAIRPAGHSRNNSDPPKYNEYIGDEDADHQLLNEISSSRNRSSKEQQRRPSSPNPVTMTNAERQQHSDKFDDGSTPNGSQGVNLALERNIPRAPAITRDQRVEVAEGTQHILPAQTSPPSLRDRLPSPSLDHGNKRDVQSTHYSASTYSSSQLQNGSRPPPHRHLPKRLIMPAPLNTGPPPNAAASLHIPQSQISSHVNVKQTHFQPPLFSQQSSSRSHFGNLPMTPMHYNGNTRTEDVSVSGGRKLLKRGSMINVPAPITVSFAPPIIGIHHNATDEKVMVGSKLGKIPKRLLSKRKT